MKKNKNLSERIEKKRLKTHEPKHTIRRSIERNSTVPSATRDNELATYLDSFVSDVGTLSPLPKTDFSSPEKARAAVFLLNQKLEQLDRYRKTAEALKSLLLSQDVEGELN